MGAVWYRFRAELRSRWRAWLGLALVVALGSGAVMALAAGARRTASAYDRFLDAQNAYDVLVINYPDDGTAVFDFDEIASLPMIEDSARAHFEYYTFYAGNLASEDGRIGTDINRFKILEGRHADPDAADEIVVGFILAEEHGLEVGDTVDIVPREVLDFVKAPDTAPNPFDGALPPEELESIVEQGRRLLEEIPDGKARIVGVEASPGEFPPQFAVNLPLVHLTPAFHRLLADGEREALMIRLRDGADGVEELRAELERRSGGRPLQLLAQSDHAAEVERSIHFQAVALWVLAALTAVATVLVVGQLLIRLTVIESADHPTLRVLGLPARGRRWLGVLRAAMIGAVGGSVGAIGAWAASGAFPIGLARTAEPTPGLRADVLVLVAGIGLTVVVVSASSLWPARRVAHAGRPRARAWSSSRLARALAVRGVPVPAAVGVGMAFDSGHGRSAVPARTTLAGVVLGVGTLTAALTFGASLTHLVSTPRLYGVSWDLELVSAEGSGLGPTGVDLLLADDRVTALTIGGAYFGADFLEVDGLHMDAVVLGVPLEGDIAPSMLEGRPPAAADEIALGRQTLRSLGAELGDSVEVRTDSATSMQMEVVGTAVLPTVGENTQLGRGALVTPEAALVLDDEEGGIVTEELGVLVRLEPGADGDDVVADLDAQLDLGLGIGVLANRGPTPTDIVNFGRVESLPFVLGGILAAIAAAALAHLLVSAVQRRRRELAMLKTLGFVRRQVALTVAIQSTTVAVVGVLIGVPGGIALGRWAWTLMADDLGVVPRPQIPALTLALLALGAVVVANAIAFVPGRLAARARPATVLRSE